MKPRTYAQAGVDLGVASRIKETIAEMARSTYGPRVVAGVGPFAGLFKLEGYRNPVLVASVDGVGTKLRLASLPGRLEGVGVDLVHHCVNDILCLGAEPLFFLDYVAMGRLQPPQVEAVVIGITGACRDLGLALLGGETAEMPGFYREGDVELVGFILGVVERDKIIDGRTIVPGDKILALPSSGLHTNGYSLARQVFNLEQDSSSLNRFYPELGKTLGEELLNPHRCYQKELRPWLPRIKGLAHITGGGLEGNLPRSLPSDMAARIKLGSWNVPPIFRLIQQTGPVTEAEMWRVFNMGIGMAIILSPQDVPDFLTSLPQAFPIGEIGEGPRGVILE